MSNKEILLFLLQHFDNGNTEATPDLLNTLPLPSGSNIRGLFIDACSRLQSQELIKAVFTDKPAIYNAYLTHAGQDYLEKNTHTSQTVTTMSSSRGYHAVVYKVFIASPCDVPEERQIVRDVLDEWNMLHSQKEQKVFLPIGWETHSYSLAGAPPQQTLNKQILYDADLLIGVFWMKLGTPTDAYPSGSVEEFEEHVKSGKPAMLYFSNKALPQNFDEEQFRRLKEFKKSCQPRSFYKEYSGPDAFRDLLRNEIVHLVNNLPYFTEPAIQTPVSANNIPQLSDAAKEMLLRSHGTGKEIVNIRTRGGVTIGPNGHVEDLDWDNKREIAKQESALEELEKIGFIHTKSSKREIFNITNAGYEWIDKHEK